MRTKQKRTYTVHPRKRAPKRTYTPENELQKGTYTPENELQKRTYTPEKQVSKGANKKLNSLHTVLAKCITTIEKKELTTLVIG
jgi:hypothetical protein